ncbi:winged helix-turn-helix transcriptional regulator [Maricaulis maris]|uniref:HxlR family transcriptional regulator n=1 Tax=Maricaulis maris TaxID=74318 RepID=A0A495DCV0_9PROT|nr:winged helix-turn-helix transcriptional regulator [Maricaulis maris]RKR00119.1 HxlR family transcriptional regulator [Maricaulis maris]
MNIVRPAKRYNDACAAAHAMELLGERWAMLVVRELHTGPRRFTDIRASLPGISANVLTQRLEGLELAGIIQRRELPPPAASRVYELTDWGRESEPIFQVLGRWAARSPWHDPTQAFSAASFMLSLRTMFDAERGKAYRGRLNFIIGHTRLACRIADGALEIAPGEFDAPDVVMTGEGPALAGFIYGGVPLAALEADGAVAVTGDRALAEALPALFPLPDRFPMPNAAD